MGDLGPADTESISGRDHRGGAFEIQGIIGEGTYGVVFKAKNYKTGELVAIKRSKSTATSEAGGVTSASAIREIKLLREICQTPCPRTIVELMDVYVDRLRRLNLVYRYVEMDLSYIVNFHGKQNLAMNNMTIKSITWQVLDGIKYLHENWVIHRDLKPSNILVARGDAPRDKGQVKIADFGMSRLFQDPYVSMNLVDAVVVTSWYRAPELLLEAAHYSCAVDLWAIGCIMAEMVMKQPIFRGEAIVPKDKKEPYPFQTDQVDKVFKHLGTPSVDDWPELVHLPKGREALGIGPYESGGKQSLWQAMSRTDLGNAGLDLMKACLEFNPNKRISAAEALEHQYFKELPKPLTNIFEKPNSDIYPPRVIKDAPREAKATSDLGNNKRPWSDAHNHRQAPSAPNKSQRK